MDRRETVTEPRRRTRTDRGRRHSRKRKHPALAWFGIAALVSVAVAAGFIIYRFAGLNSDLALAPAQAHSVRRELDKPSRPKNGVSEPQYVLLLGGDMRPGQTRGRSDSLMILRIDSERKKVAILSIPRDTRVPIDGYGNRKINAAFAYGGPALAVRTVKDFTGLPINHFALVDFEGFVDLVDIIGGVELDVAQSIDDTNGATAGGVSTVTHIDAGRQVLNGAQALTYVRSREFADGDFTRVKHQQQLLVALATQTLRPANIGRLPSALDVATRNIKTDMTTIQLAGLAQQFRGIDSKDIQAVTLKGVPRTIDGASYVIADQEAKTRIISGFRRGRVVQAED